MKTLNKLTLILAIQSALVACGGGAGSTGNDEVDAALSLQFDQNSEEQTPTVQSAVANTIYIAPGIGIDQTPSTDAHHPFTEVVSIEHAALQLEQTPLFSDTATYVEIESYRINIGKLIKFKRVTDSADGENADTESTDGEKLEITNWIPRDLQNVVVVATYEDELYEVINIDTLPGLNRFSIDLPWDIGATTLKSTNGTTLDFSSIDTSEVTFSILPQDEVQRSIASIDLNWNLSFPDRVMNGRADVCRAANVVWRPTHPQDARYLLSFMINAAQTVSHPKFYDFWVKTPFASYDGAKNNENNTLTLEEFQTFSEKEQAQYDEDRLNAGLYFNKDHRKMVFERYFKKTFALGVTGGGGLGGGSTVGINHTKFTELAWTYGKTAAEAGARNDWFLPEDDKSYGRTPWNIFGHETGHALGFGHQETYTVRNKYSHIAVGNIVYSWLMDQGKTIVTKDTMVGRDTTWEKPYNKKASADKRSRPRCGDAFEWGGVYGRHDIQMPQNNTPEWRGYIEAHKQGKGLEYLRALNVNESDYYSWIN